MTDFTHEARKLGHDEGHAAGYNSGLIAGLEEALEMASAEAEGVKMAGEPGPEHAAIIAKHPKLAVETGIRMGLARIVGRLRLRIAELEKGDANG